YLCSSFLSSSVVFILFFFHCSVHHRALHSFPTRRSSDLGARTQDRKWISHGVQRRTRRWAVCVSSALASAGRTRLEVAAQQMQRSEVHTSELQSPYDLVCRLLLEKKKKKTNSRNTT